MKKFLAVILIVICCVSLFANPVMPVCISEFAFTDSTWTIEIFDYYQIGEPYFDGSWISSNSSTVYFVDGITPNDDLIYVVNQDDVETPFIFDHSNDTIFFHGFSYLEDEITFGSGTFVNPPDPDQSLTRAVFWDDDPYPPFVSEFFLLVKENQPTMGSNPFSLNSAGIFNGYVFDSQMNPVENVFLEYSPHLGNNYDDIYTNEVGYFYANLPGLNYNFNIHLAALASLDTTLTIEPDSTYFYEFVFDSYIQSDVNEVEIPAYYYNLSNHPNPFNPSTEISFQISDISDQNLEIQIFNSKGQEVVYLPITHSQNHQVSVEWNGTNNLGRSCPSGVYLYKLVSEEKELAVNKMLLLK
jgi:FlgD Ig-like domain